MTLKTLVEISNRYGSDSDFVLAGGGNTSLKKDGVMYVKASGTSLSDIDESGFVPMSLEKLLLLGSKRYPEDAEKREAAALQDLMDARLSADAGRPSVETLLHALFPEDLVVHTHPALVNGLTCSKGGEKKMRSLFGESPVWIEQTDPGYILALKVKEEMDKATEKSGISPKIVFLQNHGVFVSGDSVQEIDASYTKIMEILSDAVSTIPDSRQVPAEKKDTAASVEKTLKNTDDGFEEVQFTLNRDIAGICADAEHFKAVASSFSPDHIVYGGHPFLFVDSDSKDSVVSRVPAALEDYKKTYGYPAKSVFVQGIGAWGRGKNEKQAKLAAELLADAVKVSVYSRSFGGPSFMDPERIDFITSWEVERYRAKVSGS